MDRCSSFNRLNTIFNIIAGNTRLQNVLCIVVHFDAFLNVAGPLIDLIRVGKRVGFGPVKQLLGAER